MAHVQPPFSESDLETISHTLEDAANHRELAALLSDSGLTESVWETRPPRWLRIKTALGQAQGASGSGIPVLKFISVVLRPSRLVQDPPRFDALREAVNLRLAFIGLQFRTDGKCYKVPVATSIDDARAQAGRLRQLLEQRNVHPDVLRFCRPELTQGNYFHAVLEATKSVSEKLREKSGLQGDGGQLAQATHGGTAPVVAFNTLRTATEVSEQRGLCNLFTGMFGTFRNTTAHGPKLSWNVSEADALDLLTMVSFLHRRLDGAVRRTPTP